MPEVVSIGAKYRFSYQEEDYDGTLATVVVDIHAFGYTQACDTLQVVAPSKQGVKFLGERQ